MVAGGAKQARDEGREPTDTVLVYDTTGDSWSVLPPAPRQRSASASGALLGNWLFVVGGFTRDGVPATALDSAQIISTGAGAQAKLDLALALDSSGSLASSDPENKRSEGAATVLFNIPFFVDVRTAVISRPAAPDEAD